MVHTARCGWPNAHVAGVGAPTPARRCYDFNSKVSALDVVVDADATAPACKSRCRPTNAELLGWAGSGCSHHSHRGPRLHDSVTMNAQRAPATASWWTTADRGADGAGTRRGAAGTISLRCRPIALACLARAKELGRPRCFAARPELCPCGARREVLSPICDPMQIRRVLEHMGLPADPPERAPPRAVQGVMDFGEE